MRLLRRTRRCKRATEAVIIWLTFYSDLGLTRMADRSLSAAANCLMLFNQIIRRNDRLCRITLGGTTRRVLFALMVTRRGDAIYDTSSGSDCFVRVS